MLLPVLALCEAQGTNEPTAPSKERTTVRPGAGEAFTPEQNNAALTADDGLRHHEVRHSNPSILIVSQDHRAHRLTKDASCRKLPPDLSYKRAPPMPPISRWYLSQISSASSYTLRHSLFHAAMTAFSPPGWAALKE